MCVENNNLKFNKDDKKISTINLKLKKNHTAKLITYKSTTILIENSKDLGHKLSSSLHS